MDPGLYSEGQPLGPLTFCEAPRSPVFQAPLFPLTLKYWPNGYLGPLYFSLFFISDCCHTSVFDMPQPRRAEGFLDSPLGCFTPPPSWMCLKHVLIFSPIMCVPFLVSLRHQTAPAAPSRGVASSWTPCLSPCGLMVSPCPSRLPGSCPCLCRAAPCLLPPCRLSVWVLCSVLDRFSCYPHLCLLPALVVLCRRKSDRAVPLCGALLRASTASGGARCGTPPAVVTGTRPSPSAIFMSLCISTERIRENKTLIS